MLETGVVGEATLRSVESVLAAVLDSESPLQLALSVLAVERRIPDFEFVEMMNSTAVVTRTWSELAMETSNAIAGLHKLPPSALRLAGRALQLLIAEASNANAVATYEGRRTLTRSELVTAVADVAAHIDLMALEGALADGICDTLDYSPILGRDADRFYEGAGTQPFHVSSGLVVPRPDVLSEVVAGLGDQGSVVITGPSGVGKSAIMWTVPLAMPGVLWFRVARLAEADVAAILRLASAYGASEAAPVGFIVDGAGTGPMLGWEFLRAETAGRPGILLLGSARTEDLPILGDLSDCATVSVVLDESAAEGIFDGLLRRGATGTSYWREAYQSSHGLTLEFTHLLTRGRRLDDVIGEQVRRRIIEGRNAELEILALVSTADRWSGRLSTSAVLEACSMAPYEMRKAVERLSGEHLLIERDGFVGGLHRLRSEAIGRAIHAVPPPRLAETLMRTIPMLHDDDLHRFVVNAIRDEPSLSDQIIGLASANDGGIRRLIAFTHGLRLADFHDQIVVWRAIAAKHEVNNSTQLLVFLFALAGLEVPDFMPGNLREVCDEMKARVVTGRTADLAARIGPTTWARLLASCDSLELGTHVLSILSNDGRVARAIESVVDIGSPFIESLRDGPVERISDCIAAARACDKELATFLLESIGGQAEILKRIRQDNPWITELEVRTGFGEATRAEELVGYCRLLLVENSDLGDARDAAVALGRTLLRCLPEIARVDVQVLLPGAHEIKLGEYTGGRSGLLREYDHPDLDVAWNQARIRAVVAVIGATDTDRLGVAVPLLIDTVEVVREIAKWMLLADRSGADPEALVSFAEAARDRAHALRPSLRATEIGDTAFGQLDDLPISDDISNLVTDVVENIVGRLSRPDNYAALAAFIGDSVLGERLPAVKAERWNLVGVDPYPPSLDELGTLLADLHALVYEMSTEVGDRGRVLRSARAGRPEGALGRAADACRTADRRRRQLRREELKEVIRLKTMRTNVIGEVLPIPRIVTRWAITVELGNLREWGTTVGELADRLLSQQRAGESYVVIPLRQGRPVPSLAMSLIMGLLPAVDIDDWLGYLKEPHSAAFADGFLNAINALQTISGISELPRIQRGHERVLAVAARAELGYANARERFPVAPEDPLVEALNVFLDQLTARVRLELDRVPARSCVASELVSGIYEGTGDGLFGEALGARLLALEWEIDSDAAIEFFESL